MNHFILYPKVHHLILMESIQPLVLATNLRVWQDEFRVRNL